MKIVSLKTKHENCGSFDVLLINHRLPTTSSFRYVCMIENQYLRILLWFHSKDGICKLWWISWEHLFTRWKSAHVRPKKSRFKCFSGNSTRWQSSFSSASMFPTLVSPMQKPRKDKTWMPPECFDTFKLEIWEIIFLFNGIFSSVTFTLHWRKIHCRNLRCAVRLLCLWWSALPCPLSSSSSSSPPHSTGCYISGRKDKKVSPSSFSYPQSF